MSETPCFIVVFEDRPLNLGGESSPAKLGGGVSETPCFIVFFEDRPLNLGGESSPPKFRGCGLAGFPNLKSQP